MSAALADNALYAALFGDAEAAALFAPEQEIATFLRVEAELARAQGGIGLIPQDAALWLAETLPGLHVPPESLSQGVAENGVAIPALLTQIRQTVRSEHLDYLHFGATSQDIIDTAQALRMQELFKQWDIRLTGLITVLARLAREHADTQMAGRTYGQIATPTTFGALVAAWGWPLLSIAVDLATLTPRVCAVSLSGATGTSAMFGAQTHTLRALLAKRLGLSDPGHSTHTNADPLITLGGLIARLAGALGKIGEDLLLLTQSLIAEVRLGQSGLSSTMPQKENPVAPSVLVALCRQIALLTPGLAVPHRQNRDGAAWFTAWLTLPQLAVSTSRALALALELAENLQPDATVMARNLGAEGGLAHAEALTFARARQTGRSQATQEVKVLIGQARQTGQSLLDLAKESWTDLDLLAIRQDALGMAPEEARQFADAVLR